MDERDTRMTGEESDRQGGQQAGQQDDRQRGGAGFTQAQVSGIVARESRAAIEKLLGELGFEGEGTAKERVAAFKARQEALACEAQATQAALGTAREELRREREARARLSAQAEALGKGVPARLVPHYLDLAGGYLSGGAGGESGAGDGGADELSAALDAALIDFPLRGGGPVFVAPASGGPAQNEDEFAKRINKYRRT